MVKSRGYGIDDAATSFCGLGIDESHVDFLHGDLALGPEGLVYGEISIAYMCATGGIQAAADQRVFHRGRGGIIDCDIFQQHGVAESAQRPLKIKFELFNRIRFFWCGNVRWRRSIVATAQKYHEAQYHED